MKKIGERLIRYAQIYTTSDPSVEDIVPSTERQREFAKILMEELKSMGVEDVFVNEKSFLMAKIPSNLKDGKVAPKIGFISHLDTAPDAKGEGVKPQIHEEYDGGDIKIKDGCLLSPKEAKDLELYKGHTIITSSGDTLLGADDKAGISAIMEAVKEILEEGREHGDILIAFTPDEEIGVGGDYFDVEAFGADFAYTLDGETLGEFNYETFCAAEVTVKVKGHNVHPGNAKGVMKNSCDIACLYATKMPEMERPEKTEGYEGFYHLCEMKGSVEESELIYIIRDFDTKALEQKKKFCMDLAKEINEEFGEVIEVIIKDEYRNMREVLEEKTEIIELALKAYKEVGVEPIIRPIRGGTDGSKLSFKGLPCPNIFVGGNNFHSVKEFCSVEAMDKAKEIIKEIVNLAIK